ncbi:MAG: hypothetical protein WEF51_05035 [Chloroflexota bacterium]
MPETKTILTRRLVAPALIAIALAFPVGIAAHTTEQIAETGGMTLPLLGASVVVNIELDAVGHIEAVTFTPAGDLTETKSGDHRVRFANTDGTTRVDIAARGHKLSLKAKTGSLDELVGERTWSAAVFGPGTESTVVYTIGKVDGKPTLVFGAVTVPASVTATPSAIKASGNNVSGMVTFESDGYVKTLKFWIHVDQGGGKAMLKIVLSGKDKQKLSGLLADLVAVGTRTWSGNLCDGTAATVDYRVTAEGTVEFLVASPATVSVKTKGKGFTATFDGTKVRVSVSLKVEGTSAELKVDGKSGKCKEDKAKKVRAERKEKPAKATREGES